MRAPRSFKRPCGGAEVKTHPGATWWIGEDEEGHGKEDDGYVSVDSDDDDPPPVIEDDITPRLLEAFSPLNENNLPEIGAVYTTIVTAVNLGVGTAHSSGHSVTPVGCTPDDGQRQPPR